MRINAADGPVGNLYLKGDNVILQSINTDAFTMNGYLALNEYNHNHYQGWRTSAGTVWSNSDGHTGNPIEYTTYPGDHKHQVTDHTHQVYI